MTIDYDHDRNNVVKSDHGHFFAKCLETSINPYICSVLTP